jgi:drug/metabolite transporter (DMT)-like permease
MSVDAHKSLPAARVDYLVGCALVLAAGIVWSLGVILIRQAGSTDAWQYMFWRSIAFAVALALLVRANDRRSILSRLAALTPMSWLGSVMMTLTATSFIAAAKSTTIANTFIILATAPLLTALIARLVLGEKLTMPTLGAIAVAIGGFGVMAGGDVSGFGRVGDLFAVVAVVTFAGYIVCTRGAGRDDLLPMLLASALMTVPICAVMTLIGGRPLIVPASDIGLAFLHGGLVLVTGFFLFTRGSRKVGATELAVLAQTESVFGPLWAFLFLSETPATSTIIGGSVVLAAVIGQALVGARSHAARSA